MDGKSVKGLVFFAAAIFVFLVDRISKVFILKMAEKLPINLIDGFVRLIYATNTGVAFGLFKNLSWLWTIFILLVLPLTLYIAMKTERYVVWFGFIFGGGLGNLADRIFLGHVVDFVDIGIGGVRWPAFNIADAFLTVSILYLLIFWRE